MAKAWVLDSDTKGTGAQMVPLDKVLERPARQPEPVFVPRKPRPRPAEADTPRQPRRFKVVDVMTREVLAQDADARTAVAVLGRVRSSADVVVSVWQPRTQRWRPLTLGEQRALWGLRAT